MKILFINYEFPPIGGGGGTTSKYLAKELADLGIEVKILTAGFQDLPRIEKIDNFEIVRVKCRRKLKSQCSQREMLSFVLSAINPMFRIIDEWKPDIIHIFFALPTGPLGWLAKKIKKIPYIVYLLGADVPGFSANEVNWEHGLLKGISRQIWLNADAVVANSSGLKDLGKSVFSDIDIKVITNGVDTKDFFIKQNKVQFGNIVNLLFVGRFASQKGLIVLLKAIDIVVNKKNIKNIKLRIVGDGSEKEGYLKFIKEKQLSNYVEFFGWMKLESLNNIYNNSDIFVLPSTFEGMPSVVLQAMACGLPIISTRVFGSEDLVSDGKNGYLTKINDSEMLADAIIKLVNNSDLSQRMGRESSVLVKNFSWNKIANKFIDLYSSII